LLALDTPLAFTVLGLHLWDFVTLVAYLVVITGMGLWAARKVHTVRDFFMPRRFGKAMMMMHTFGTGTHSDQAVGVASKTFTDGLSGIWYQWLWLFCTPFYWLIAPFMKRFRAITTGDAFEARYDKGVAGLYAVVGMAQLTLNIGIMLKGSGEVIGASTGGMVSPHVAIAVMTILFVIYGIAGGLSAAIVTDFLQGIMTILFSFLLLPFVLDAVGGMAGLRAQIDAGKLSLVAPAGITAFYIVVIAFNALVGIVVQPHTMGICAALTGLAAVAYFAGKDVKPDAVYGTMAREFLPQIGAGLLGVFLAALLASVMSSCDSFMTATSGLFTQNIYRPLFPRSSQKTLLLVGRIASLAVVAGGVVFAYTVPGIVKALEIFWKMAAMVGIAFWLGLLWRRTTSLGAWAATLGSLGAWWLSTTERFITWAAGLPQIESIPFVWAPKGTPEIYMPWQMVFYLAVGTLLGVVVSLLTKPVDEAKLDNFYALTRTPIVPGEELGEPCTIPEGTETLPRRSLLPFAGLEVPVPSLTSVIGFVVGWVCVAALIGAFLLIAKG